MTIIVRGTIFNKNEFDQEHKNEWMKNEIKRERWGEGYRERERVRKRDDDKDDDDSSWYIEDIDNYDDDDDYGKAGIAVAVAVEIIALQKWQLLRQNRLHSTNQEERQW